MEQNWLGEDGLYRVPTDDIIIIKAHAAGVEWFEKLGLPPTRTLSCDSLMNEKYASRTYLQGDRSLGRHYIYRAPTDIRVPTVEYDCYLHVGSLWTRVPPTPGKEWLVEMDPVTITTWDWVADIPELDNRAALDKSNML